MMKKVRSFLFIAIALILFAASFPITDFSIEANAANRIVMTADEFIECLKTASARKNKYNNQYPYNLGYYNGSEISWDCWNLGKSIIWTNGAIVNNYTVGTYAKVDTSCGLGDWDGLTIVQQAPNFSNDFSNLVPGEWLYLNGHTGYYIGNGQVIECTGGSWGIYGITYSQIDGNGNRSRNGKAEGKWLYHGMVPWLDYTTNSEAKKLTKKTYPSHCTIKVTENDKNIMSLPCSNKTNSKSDKVESAPKGSTYEAIGLILNTEDNLWYKVKAKNGKEGYIFAGNVSFVSAITSDITGPGISVPSNHTHGKNYVLTGSVNSSYNELTNVSAYVYSGSNKITGGTASVNGKSYSLGRSAIDNQTEFNKLAVGQYTYKVTASYKSYYAKTDKAYGTKTGTVNVYSQAFNVVSDSVSPTVPQQPTTIIYPNNEGIYKIASGVGNNMYLDFACTNDNVQIYENCDGHSNSAFVISQYFKLTHIGEGWYSIINIGNGKAMDVYCGNSKPETNIHQWEYDGNNAQLFRFYDAGNGYCYIQSKLGCYADVQNGDCVNNANVWTYIFNGSNAQKWKLEMHSHSYIAHYEADHPHRVYNRCSCGDWYYTGATTSVSSCSQCNPAEPSTMIYPTNGGIYKIAYGGGNNMYLGFAISGNNVQIYENCDGHSDPAFVKSQYFKLTHVGNGWYSIINVGNGKAIDIDGINPTSGTNIQQWEYLGNDGQLYRFYDAGNGYCYIKSKLGTYVDKKDGDTSTDTNVWSYEFNGTVAQKWKLLLIEDIISNDESYSLNNMHYSSAEKLRFQGWAFSNRGKPVTISYVLDSNSPVTLKSVSRPDVQKAYSKICAYTDVGYDFTIDLSKLSAGKHTIKVIVNSFFGNTLTVSNLQFYVDTLGDVDGDGQITSVDARLTLRASVGLENLSNDLIKRSDVDKDNTVSAADARLILRASVKLEDPLYW